LIENDFVLFSGFTMNFFTNLTRKVFAYNMTAGTKGSWREMQEIPIEVGLTHGAYVVVGSSMYICGGYLDHHPGNSSAYCLRYDHRNPIGSQWSFFASLPGPRAGGGMHYIAERNSLLFATGASRPNASDPVYTLDHNDVWELSLSNMASGWIPRSPLPYMGNHVGYTSVVYNGKNRYYVLGGQKGEDEHKGNYDSLYEFDVSLNIWIKRANMPEKRGHFSSSVIPYGCGFLIVGGATNAGKSGNVTYYSVDTDSWSHIGILPRKLNTPVCRVYAGSLICESGLLYLNFSWYQQIA
jgi:Galactose oxidase, central domain